MKHYMKPAKIVINVIAILALVLYPGAITVTLQSDVAQAAPQGGGNGNPGSIKTTNTDCGTVQQNVNHYNVNDHVYIHGENFNAGTWNWDITGQPGNASQHPNIVVASGSFTVDETGEFCFDAYTILPGDNGTYQATFNGKKDNYRVNDPDDSCINPLDYVNEQGKPGRDGKVSLSDAVVFTSYYESSDAAMEARANVAGSSDTNGSDLACATKYYSTAQYACPLDCDEDTHEDEADAELSMSTQVTPKSNPLSVAPRCTEGPAYANEVIVADQGTRNDGGTIDVSRSDANQVLGTPDNVFFSLGRKADHPYGGSVTVKFAYPVVNVAGDDLSFHEVTNGDRVSYGMEKAQVEVSQDGSTWALIGEIHNQDASGNAYLDFNSTGWTWIQYVRVNDTTDFEGVFANVPSADGYDLDAIDATYQLCSCVSPLDYVSTDGTLVPDGLISLSDAVAFTAHYSSDELEADVNGNSQIDYGDYLCASPYFANAGPYTCGIECPAVCGDASVNQEIEQCDDGNIADGDGCSATCQIEPQAGSLTICKYNDEDRSGTYDNQIDTPLQWSMSVYANSGSNAGDTWFTGTNPQTGCVTLEGETGFPFGNYDVTEASEEGWTSTFPSGSDTQNITLNAETPDPVVIFLNAENTPADLAITKTDNQETAQPGDTLTYEVMVTNTGETDAYNVQVVDVIPAEVASVSNISDSGIETAGTIVWDNLTVPALDSITLTFDGTLSAEFPEGTTVVHNEATLGCSDVVDVSQDFRAVVFDGCPYSGTATDDTSVNVIPQVITVTTPVLTIEKTADKSTVVAGGQVTYTVTVSNTGDATAQNVTLADPLPGDFFITLNNATSYDASIGDLAAGEASTVSYTVTVPGTTTAGDYVNTATASADTLDPVSASATVTVSRIPQVLGEETSNQEKTKNLDTGKIVDDTTRDGQVLGAEDTLAETGAGVMEYLFFILGILLLGFGAFGVRTFNTKRDAA